MTLPYRRPTTMRRGLSVVAVVAALTVQVLSAVTSSAVAAPGPGPAPALLHDASGAAAAPASARASRSRTVTLDPSVLPSTVPSGGSTARIRFDLFADMSVEGVVTRVESDGDTTSWTGTLTNGYFYAARADAVYVVHVATPAGVYEVSSIGGSTRYRVIQIDPRQMTEPLADTRLPARTSPPAGPAGPTADARGRIDVLVGYTQAALAAEGGSTSAMRARIALAIAETNGGYRASGVTTSVRLVHQQAIKYVESSDITVDIDTLADPSDGINDNMPVMRDVFGADVAVMIERTDDACGIARQIGASADSAYAVVEVGCATGNYSFGHEIGHLQGARHDAYVDSGSTPYVYGHGYVNVAAGWRTIMAYDNKCVDAGKHCTRLQYWSNPDVRYQNRPTGTSNARNADVLNATAFLVANFRQQVVGDDVDSRFTSGTDGWTRVTGSWSAANGTVGSAGVSKKGAAMTRTGSYEDFTATVRMRRTGDVFSANRVIVRGTPGALNSTNQWMPSYMFQYTNDGSVSVFYVDSAGTASPVLDWTTSSAVRGNDWNTLEIVASGLTFRFLVNGVTVYSGTPGASQRPPWQIGRVGFGFYRDEPGAFAVDSASITQDQVTGTAAAEPSAAPAVPSLPTRHGDADSSR